MTCSICAGQRRPDSNPGGLTRTSTSSPIMPAALQDVVNRVVEIDRTPFQSLAAAEGQQLAVARGPVAGFFYSIKRPCNGVPVGGRAA